jgi:hypothetical protein
MMIAALKQARTQTLFQLLNWWCAPVGRGEFARGPREMHFVGHRERTKPSKPIMMESMINKSDYGERIIRFLNDGKIVNDRETENIWK